MRVPWRCTTHARPEPIYVIGYNFSENMEVYFGENQAQLCGDAHHLTTAGT